jgi:hypothetical protein
MTCLCRQRNVREIDTIIAMAACLSSLSITFVFAGLSADRLGVVFNGRDNILSPV